MTDARMPGPWLHRPEYWELSDRAWRTLGSSLMLSAEQGTDGRIGPGYLTLLHPDGLPDHVTAELVARGHWERTDDGGIQVIDWAGVKGQSTAAEVEANRARKRRNQAAYRARQAAVDAKQAAARPPRPAAAPPTVTGNVTARVTGRRGSASSLSSSPRQGGEEEKTMTSARRASSPRSAPDTTPLPVKAAAEVTAAHLERARADLRARAAAGRLRLITRTGQRIHVHPAPYAQTPLPFWAEAVPPLPLSERVSDSPPVAASA